MYLKNTVSALHTLTHVAVTNTTNICVYTELGQFIAFHCFVTFVERLRTLQIDTSMTKEDLFL